MYNEPNHPLDHLFRGAEVVEFWFRRRIDENVFDLTLHRGKEVCQLRFFGVTELRAIQPVMGCHLELVDVSGRGWENIKLWLRSYEDEGPVEFYAREVVLIEPDS